MDRFLSFSPAESGQPGRAGDRTGMGFDEIALSAGVEKPRGAKSSTRGGKVLSGRKGKAGADLRQYFANGSSWWGLEASGAASGGTDGYMELLFNAGQDWPLFSERLRIGGQVSAGLGGGGDIDTGGGWLLRAGPTLRWITPWGPTLRMDAGYMKAPQGRYESAQLRFSLALPLEQATRMLNSPPLESGTVHQQAWYLSVPRFKSFEFKDGSREAVTGLGIGMTRDFAGPWYGTAQAGSAAFGKAGAFSYGLFGLGAQTPRLAGGWRVGAEALVGAAGALGVSVNGNGNGQDWSKTPAMDLIRSRIKVKSMNFMRGRTFLNKFLIIDEAQNLTPKQMKTLITRAGPGTKIVCLGNIAQIDTPYLTEGSSGLTYVVDRFKGWPHAGHITLQRGERSRLADYASDAL